MAGPLSKKKWGRMWAKAFVHQGFKDTLEKSPQAAASQLFGGVKPLFNTNDPNSYIRFFFNKFAQFSLAERQAIRDGTFDKTDPRWIDLAKSLKGNEFSLINKQTNVVHPLDPQNIDGPIGATLPLAREEWVRTYAEVFLDHAPHQGFKGRLEDDPAMAVEEFDTNHTLGHTAGARLFQFPAFNDLLAIIPAGDPLENPATLRQVLQQIADGLPSTHEAHLQVNLSC